MLEKHAVPDAVVIRRQDVFAGPGLHAYASVVQTAMELLMAMADIDEADLENLGRVRDYFHEQAVLADEIAGKIPD
jgi:hypothetical protein